MTWRLRDGLNWAATSVSDSSGEKRAMTDLTRQEGIHRQIFQDQRYTVAIPEGYADDEPRPLFVALHWGWQGIVPNYYGHSYLSGLVEPALRELGAIIVAPDCMYEDWVTAESEQAVRDLVKYLRDGYNIDAGKIAITGFSRGGRGAWYIAARNQELFSMASPMAARPQPDSTDVEWRIPLCIIHGRNDEVFRYESTEQVATELQKKNVNIKFELLEGISHYETGRYVQPLKDAVGWIGEVWGIRR